MNSLGKRKHPVTARGRDHPRTDGNNGENCPRLTGAVAVGRGTPPPSKLRPNRG